MALPIYTHIPNLKVLTKIFLKLSRPKGNLCGDGVTVLNPKYPRLSSGDTNIDDINKQCTHWILYKPWKTPLLISLLNLFHDIWELQFTKWQDHSPSACWHLYMWIWRKRNMHIQGPIDTINLIWSPSLCLHLQSGKGLTVVGISLGCAKVDTKCKIFFPNWFLPSWSYPQVWINWPWMPLNSPYDVQHKSYWHVT